MPGSQLTSYTIATPIFEGPLDLLLHLIERAELDITRLALAEVTDQYLEHIRTLPDLTADEVSAFLVIAAKLIQIKSEALLPRPPVREVGEEDPGEALARQLILYKRFRQIADLLSQNEHAGLRTYLRLAAPPKIEGAVDLSGITLQDLMLAAQEILDKESFKQSVSSAVPPPRVSIREKITIITQILHAQRRSSFNSLVGNKASRLEIVVTFLAILELVKRHLVSASQKGLFEEIDLEAAEDWDKEQEIEVEFGD